MPKHLRYDYQTAYYEDNGNFDHAEKVMKELGITWIHSTPQSMGDQFWFWNCENIPETLPPQITDLGLDPLECIGYGLSEEKAKEIAGYKGSC